MKKLEQKDLLLSPKLVTDLTGNGTGNTNGDINRPNQTSEEGDQCLSEVDNPCASDDNCTGDVCLLTGDDTCLCTKVCPETQTDHNQCCVASEDIATKCCINPTFSIEICQESEVEICPISNECADTDVCVNPNITITCP